ncbi:hypothetical protein HK096_006731 [Nowakowskiella sp. JEL0078]|nr:hypothetical protein HK096_006731 [Nowakowskiella sp. JEL0078]
MEIEGNQYIKSLVDFIRTHENILLQNASFVPKFTPSAILYSSTSTQSPLGLAGALGLGSLLGATQKSVLPPEIDSSVQLQPFTLSIDPHHITYILDNFESFASVTNFIKTGVFIPQSPPVQNSTNIATKEPESTQWFTWPGNQNPHESQNHQTKQFQISDEDLVYIYKFFQQVRVLKLTSSGQKWIKGLKYEADASVSLLPFKNLITLELHKVFPSWVSDWGNVKNQISTLVCQNSIKKADEIIVSLSKVRQSLALYYPSEDLKPTDPNSPLFPQLKHLDISHNNLTDISALVLSQLPFCTELNLSFNKFESIPSSITTLTELQDLDFSGNKISSLLIPIHTFEKIQTKSFKNLYVLHLEKNLLENLVGIDRFESLRKIDICENKISNVFEIGRLASLAKVNDIRIAKNPLVSLDNYRINIFTYFKDRALTLTLDGHLPSMTEKNTIRALTVLNESNIQDREIDLKNDASYIDEKVLVKGKRKKPKREKNDDELSSGSGDSSTKINTSQILFESSFSPNGSRRHRLAELENAILSPIEDGDSGEGEHLLVSRKTKGKTKPAPQRRQTMSEMLDTDANVVNVNWKERSIDAAKNLLNDTKSSNLSGLSEFPKLQADSTLEEASTTITPAARLKLALAKLRERGDLIKKTQEDPILSPPSTTTTQPLPTSPALLTTFEETSTAKIELQSSHPSKALSTTGSISTLSHLGSIGPYRRIYEYGTDGVTNLGFKKPLGSSKASHGSAFESQGGLSPTEEKNFTTSKDSRISTTSLDVEAGTSDEFEKINFGFSGMRIKAQNIRPLPPLSISPANTAHRSIFTVSNNLKGNRSSTNMSIQGSQPAMRDFLKSTTSSSSVNANGHSSNNPRAPPLILSRPVTFTSSYTIKGSTSTGTVGNVSRGVSAESVSSDHSESSHSFSVNYSAAPNGTDTGPSAAYNSYYAQSVSGPAVPGSIVGSGLSRSNSELERILPRAPSIPFLTMTNSLQLYLKFQVFESDDEKILCWIPGSFIAQLPPYMAEGDDGWSKRNDNNQGNWFTRSFGGGKPEKSNSGEKRENIAFPSLSAAELLDRVEPVERPGFFLLTDKNLYVFAPNFGFPYDSKEAFDPYVQYINKAMQNIRYDDPTKFLTLLYTISFSAIGRLDLGPNRQYLAVHFLRENSSKSTANESNSSSKPEYGVDSVPTDLEAISEKETRASGSKTSKNGMLNLSWYTGHHNQTPFVSLVLLTRSKTYTSNLIDLLMPILYETSGDHSSGKHIKGPDGRVRIVNQDVEWAMRTLRENVLLRKGYKDVVYSQISSSWKGSAYKNKGKKNQDSTTALADGIKTGLGWIGGLLNKPGTNQELNIEIIENTISRKPSAVELPITTSLPLIDDDDEDSAVHDGSEISKVNFEFLRLYLLVGWVSANTEKTNSTAKLPRNNCNLPSPADGTPSVRTCSLIATNDFLYLITERFDVWPPLFFPPEFEPVVHVNDTIETVGARSQPGWSSNSTAFKGLVADLVTPFSSPPLTAARVRDIRRCERWRSWRYTSTELVQQIGARVDGTGIMIMNGAIGDCRSEFVTSATDTTVSETNGAEDGSGVGSSSEVRPSLGRRGSATWTGSFFRRATTDAGNAAGWGWWVRVVFAKPELDVSGGAVDMENDEFWWDIVFSTMDSANEFLEYIRDVRGVRSSESDDIHIYDESSTALMSPSPVPGGEDEEDGDRNLFKMTRKDGVVLVIGDD